MAAFEARLLLAMRILVHDVPAVQGLDSTLCILVVWRGTFNAGQGTEEMHLTAGRLCSLGSGASPLLFFPTVLCVSLLLWSLLQEDAPVYPECLCHHPDYGRPVWISC